MADRSREALVVLRRILRAAEHQARELSRRHGLTASQLLLLQVLEQHGESSAGDIAGQLGITQATTTSLLDRLEGAGLVQRAVSDTDRRRRWVSLTADGRERLASAPDGLQEIFRARFAALAPREQAGLVEALERVSSLLDAEHIDAAPVLDIGAIDRAQKPPPCE